MYSLFILQDSFSLCGLHVVVDDAISEQKYKHSSDIRVTNWLWMI